MSSISSLCWGTLDCRICIPYGGKCVECRAGLPCTYIDDVKNQHYKEISKLRAKNFRNGMSDECKALLREKDRLRKKKSRDARKSQLAQLVAPPVFPNVVSGDINVEV